MTSRRGKIYILIGPPSVGKNTLLEGVRGRIKNLGKIISTTTREKRPQEVHGKDKFFLTDKEFDDAIRNDEFIEWQKLHGHKYGVLKKTVNESLDTGMDFIMEIEVLGASKFKEIFGKNVVMIFVLPPSFKALKERIQKRGVDNEKGVAVRLSRSKAEATYLLKCDCVLVNDDLEETISGLEKIIKKEVEEIYYSKDRLEVNSTAVVLDENAERILVRDDNKLINVRAKQGEFPYEKLIEKMKSLWKSDFKFIQDDKFMKEHNEGLNVFLPFWISINRNVDRLKIGFHYAVKFSGNIDKKKWKWVPKNEFLKNFGQYNLNEKAKKEFEKVLDVS